MNIVEDTDLEGLEPTQGQQTPAVEQAEEQPTAVATDEGTEPEQAQPPQEAVAYTDEEFEALHLNDLDESRMTPQQRKYAQKMRDLEKGYNRKFQELAQERKQYEQARQTTQQPQQTFGDVYQAFDADPRGVLQNLRTILAQKKKEDPLSDDVIRLETLRDELLERRSEQAERHTQINMVATSVNNEVRKAIPDFEEKADALTDFAVRELGYSIEEITYMTDPGKVGALAGKNTLAINRLYDLQHPKKPVKATTKIPKTEKAGSGFVEPKIKTYTKQDYIAMREKMRA